VTAKDEALAALAAHNAEVDKAAQHLADLQAVTDTRVAACRQHHATWQQIADVFGKQKSHISAKYSKRIEEIRTVRVKPTDSSKETS